MNEQKKLIPGVLEAGPVGGTAVVTPSATVPLAALLSAHILNDGEEILLALKPSIWFVALSMLRFAAIVVTLMIASKVFDDQLPGHPRIWVELGSAVLSIRLTIAILQWMSRLYVLTDLRVLRLSGVWQLQIFNCPLRKIARTRILYTMRERCCQIGSIEIIPSDESLSIGSWQAVPRPKWVNEQINAEILRARGRLCDPPSI